MAHGLASTDRTMHYRGCLAMPKAVQASGLKYDTPTKSMAWLMRGSRIAFGYGADSRKMLHEELFGKLNAATAVLVRHDPGRPGRVAASPSDCTKAFSSPGIPHVIWLPALQTGGWCIFGLANPKGSSMLRQPHGTVTNVRLTSPSSGLRPPWRSGNE